MHAKLHLLGAAKNAAVLARPQCRLRVGRVGHCYRLAAQTHRIHAEAPPQNQLQVAARDAAGRFEGGQVSSSGSWRLLPEQTDDTPVRVAAAVVRGCTIEVN